MVKAGKISTNSTNDFLTIIIKINMIYVWHIETLIANVNYLVLKVT